MSRRRLRLAVVGAASVIALAAPTTAWAHAYLLRTAPSASVTVNRPPATVSLTYSEAIEPRFAIVSVTDAAGHQQASGRPQRSPTNPNQLLVPVKRVPEGWYLVYWRVISADGHPVRGAFTFAVGPNPGPAPEFVIPSTSETAATPGLIAARWVAFLATMAAVGLLVFRTIVIRPLRLRAPGSSVRATTVALVAALAVALLATPFYLIFATARFAIRSTWDIGALVPLIRDSAFGRGFLDLEVVLVLLAAATFVLLRVERPESKQRPVSELLACTGALLAAGAALLVPGIAGHAAQTSPRAVSLLLDWVHLAAGSIWVGGLIGVFVLWSGLGPNRLAGLAVAVPRFSRTAFVSVLALIGTGTGASIIQLPTLAALWQTSYGKTILVKIGLLTATMLPAALNLTRNVPRLRSAPVEPAAAARAATLLRGLVGAEVMLTAGAVLAAATLSSLPPPPKALASIGKASAQIGPGPVVRTVRSGAYRLDFRVQPNRAAVPNDFSVTISRDGAPVRRADVTATFTMLDMEMGQLAYHLPEVSPGRYERSAPALVMVGHWGLSFDIRPPGGSPFTVLLVDRARG